MNVNWVEVDEATGQIYQTGFGLAEHLGACGPHGGLILIVDSDFHIDPLLWRYDAATHAFIPAPPPAQKPVDYALARAQAYPSAGDALAALHSWVRGDPTALQNWAKDCDAVKVQFPKP